MHREQIHGELAYVVHEFLSPEECADYISISEKIGYRDAPITTATGFRMRKDIRNNTRVMIDDVGATQKLWDRARDIVPQVHWRRPVVGLNERLRFYRYEKGQQFRPHSDGRFQRDTVERSEYTFLIYLNEDFTGGQTLIHEQSQSGDLVVEPRTGSALIFYHPILHSGAEVTDGVKYVLRTDVMFSAVEMPLKTEPTE